MFTSQVQPYAPLETCSACSEQAVQGTAAPHIPCCAFCRWSKQQRGNGDVKHSETHGGGKARIKNAHIACIALPWQNPPGSSGEPVFLMFSDQTASVEKLEKTPFNMVPICKSLKEFSSQGSAGWCGYKVVWFCLFSRVVHHTCQKFFVVFILKFRFYFTVFFICILFIFLKTLIKSNDRQSKE